VVVLEQRQREIDPRRHPRRGERGAVPDEDRVGLHGDLGVTPAQHVGVAPVGGGAAAVEQPGGREDERSGADRADPARSARQSLDGIAQRRVDRMGREDVPAHHQQRVETQPRIGGVGIGRDRHAGGRRDRAAAHRAQRQHVPAAHPVRLAEHLAGPGDVEQLHAVEHHDADAVHALPPRAVRLSVIEGSMAAAAGPRTSGASTLGDMTETIAGVDIPDTDLARAATDFVREAATPLLFDHSRRVFLFASLKGRARSIEADPELLYVGAMFHDLGLTQRYRRTDQRFEVDGADLARDFLLRHGRSPADARAVWLGIALHTTPGIPNHLEPETALVSLGVETDVLGMDLDQIATADLAAVVAAHPRPDFKNAILSAFHDGMKDRPDTTFGTMNDDVLAHFEPGFTRTDFVDVIAGSAWPE
jgi:hypothetical protein